MSSFHLLSSTQRRGWEGAFPDPGILSLARGMYHRMAWVDILGRRIGNVTAEDIAQLHLLARLDRGGVSRIEIRIPGRLLDSYHVTERMARAIKGCLMAGYRVPLQLAHVALSSPHLGGNPILGELVRVQERYRLWCEPRPAA